MSAPHVTAALVTLEQAQAHLKAEHDRLRPAGVCPEERATLRADIRFLSAMGRLIDLRLDHEEGAS